MSPLFEHIPDATFLFDQHDLGAYQRDESHIQGLVPWACIRPRSPKALKALVKFAQQEGWALIPRGSGTGKAGGCLVDQDRALLVDFSEWPQELMIDPVGMQLTASCSVPLRKVKEEAEAQLLFYPPDPNSWMHCSFGGSLATNAGGPNACKYGMTRNWIVSIDCLMSDGDIHTLGIHGTKDNAGLNLTQLLIGSEGTLGFITKATARLLPKPKEFLTLLISFDNMKDLIRLPGKFSQSGYKPSAIEFFDPLVLQELKNGGLPEARKIQGHAFAIVEFDHEGCTSDLFLASCESLFSAATHFQVASDQRQREDLWALRRLTSSFLKERYPSKISEDISIPLNQLESFFYHLEQLQLDCVTYGHLADGNLHVNFLNRDHKSLDAFEDSILNLFRLTKQHGGSLSGEHGIGLAKKKAFVELTDPYTLRAMIKIKQSLDPFNIFNPSKIF
ncbi:MAG: FAD-binding oxidoreductase [Holophagaceae bacterium]|jgi:FAD/FMN-containing dehydrogenase